MPSNTFHNLALDKKKKLIEAAKQEFSSVPFYEASINRIIEKAGISRGSFYMYFESKDDIFEYILQSYKEEIKNIIDDTFKENNGDFKKSFIMIFDKIINLIYSDDNNKIFFKNVLTGLNLKNENYIIPHKKEENCNEFEELKKIINISNLNIKDDKTLIDIFDIMISITMPLIFHTVIMDIQISSVREKYIRKLNLICEGIYKEDKNDKNI